MLKNTKGITLIALIITIIVLLILAGVTIAAITGNESAPNKAAQARIANERGEISDELALSNTTLIMKYLEEMGNKSSYYIDQATFVSNSGFHTNMYTIELYEYDVENQIVMLGITKNNGTGTVHLFEIDIATERVTALGSNANEAVYHNITYVGENQTLFSNLPTQYEEGKVTNIGQPSEQEGYVFDGWYLNENLTGDSIVKISKEQNTDITLYPKWIENSDLGYFEFSTPDANNNVTITGLTTEGKNAYTNNASDLLNLVIPKKDSSNHSVIGIGNYVFNTRNKLKTVIIHDGITSLGSEVFRDCTGIETLQIPISLSTGNDNKFYNCTGLTKVIFTVGSGSGNNYGSNGNKPGGYADTPWYKSSQNHNVDLEFREGITSIGNYQFYHCTNLNIKLLPKSLITVGASAFSGCTNMNCEIDLSNIKTLNNWCFSGTGINGTVVLPKGVTLGDSVFYGCNKIETLIIDDSITSIPNETFRDCSKISTLQMPISLFVGEQRFYNCTGLTHVILTPGSKTGYAYDSNTSGTKTHTSLPWYHSRENEITVEFQEGIESIGTAMFYNCSGLKMVHFPSTLTTIGASAFAYCTGMTGTLVFPASVTSIGNFCFSGSGVTEVTIPSNLNGSCYYGFYGSSVEKIVIADGVTSLSDCTFRDCSNLKEITLPISLNAVGGNGGLFYDSKNIEKVTLTRGNGTAFDYSSSGNKDYNYLPWRRNNKSTVTIIFNKDIVSLGANMFKSYETGTPEHLVFIYKGTQAEWDNVYGKATNERIVEISFEP